MKLEDWKNKGNYFKYGSHTVFYLDEGQGDTLICIHGFPTSCWDWHYMWPELTARFRVLAPDMLGFGFSDKPPDDVYTITYQATLHETLLSCLEIKRAHILAHDYGDTIAQELLARYEERQRTNKSGLEIRSITMLNGGLFPETHRALFIQKLLMSPLGSFIGRFITESKFRKNFADVFGPNTKPSEQDMQDYWSLLEYNNGIAASHKIIRYIEERKRMRERWVGAMQQTNVPIRLINGPVDPVSGAHMVERYKELIPNPDIVLLRNIGHYPQMEDPKGVLRAFFALIDFLEGKRNTKFTGGFTNTLNE